MPGIIRQRITHGVDHMREGIEPHHIGGAECRAFRAADDRSRQGIHHIEAQAKLPSVMNRRQHSENTDAVGNEVRRIFRPDHAFTKSRHQESLQLIEQLWSSRVAGNQLHQMHVTRRIEEMHTAEAVADSFRECLGQPVDGKT